MVAQAHRHKVQHLRAGSASLDQHFSGDTGFALLSDRSRNTAGFGNQRRNRCGDSRAGADETVHTRCLRIQDLAAHSHHALDNIQRRFGRSESIIVIEILGTRGAEDLEEVVGVDIDLFHSRVLQIACQNTHTCHVLIDTLHQTVTVIVDTGHIFGGVFQDQGFQGLYRIHIVQRCAQFLRMLQCNGRTNTLQHAHIVCGIGRNLRLISSLG